MPKKKNPTSVPTASSITPPATDVPALTPAASTVLSLLDEHDGTTNADLAARAGLGRSTVTKALATLHEAGVAVRQEGGHEGTLRVADRWFAAPSQVAPAADVEADHAATESHDPADSEATAGSADESPADATPDAGADDDADEASASTLPETETAGADTESDEPSERQPQEAAQTESTDSPDTAEDSDDATGDSVPEDGDEPDEPAGSETAEPCGSGPDDTAEPEPEAGEDADKTDTEPVDEAADPAGGDPSGTSNGGGSVDPRPEAADAAGPGLTAANGGSAPEAAQAEPSGPRLGKGELRAMIEAHMRAHPDRSFTSTEVHHVLNRSSGAIANACEILVKEGKLIVAQEKKPRRFQWNSEAAAKTA